MIGQILLTLLQHIDAERPTFLWYPVGGMVRVDAQGKQQRVVRNLYDPSGGESLACLPVGHTDYVNALR